MTNNEDRLKTINRSIITCDILAKIPGPGSTVAKQKAKDLREERKQLQQTMGLRPTQSVTNS
jgi:hypothetical protein